MNPAVIQVVGTICFVLAVLHTFSVHWLQELSHRYPEGSVGENFFHLIGEVEVVFGLWAGIFILFYLGIEGSEGVTQFLETRNFTEPMLVFVLMTLCSTRPVLEIAQRVIELVSFALPLPRPVSFYVSTLIVGPLLGSLITEPAAMTVTALILLDRFYNQGISIRLKYATLGLLFVNISIGGVLTPYAAPPVLMVAGKWGWDIQHMLSQFGWRAVIAIIISTAMTVLQFRKDLWQLSLSKGGHGVQRKIPAWVVILHLLFLFLVVVSHHHMVVFMGLFLFFLGVATVTQEYQNQLNLRSALLVAFFLGGLIILGTQQTWWLQPFLSQLSSLPLFLGSMGLTAFTDNAAITFLGSQVEGLTEVSKYALVAGSVVGGGLTVIANAPNPVGYSTLNGSFGQDGIRPLQLFLWALRPTLVAAVIFWI